MINIGGGHIFGHEDMSRQIGTYQFESFLRRDVNFRTNLDFSSLDILKFQKYLIRT